MQLGHDGLGGEMIQIAPGTGVRTRLNSSSVRCSEPMSLPTLRCSDHLNAFGGIAPQKSFSVCFRSLP